MSRTTKPYENIQHFQKSDSNRKTKKKDNNTPRSVAIEIGTNIFGETLHNSWMSNGS